MGIENLRLPTQKSNSHFRPITNKESTAQSQKPDLRVKRVKMGFTILTIMPELEIWKVSKAHSVGGHNSKLYQLPTAWVWREGVQGKEAGEQNQHPEVGYSLFPLSSHPQRLILLLSENLVPSVARQNNYLSSRQRTIFFKAVCGRIFIFKNRLHFQEGASSTWSECMYNSPGERMHICELEWNRAKSFWDCPKRNPFISRQVCLNKSRQVNEARFPLTELFAPPF